jgi:hypothetical protein
MPLNPRLRLPLQFLALVVVLLAYCLASPWQIRFSYVALNNLAAIALTISLPVSILWIALCAQHKVLKIVGIVFSALVALPTLLFAAFVLLQGVYVVENNIDRSFTLLSEAKGPTAYYRLYRSDCGATCSTDLVLRKEYDPHVGVKLVTQIWFRRFENAGSVHVDDRGTIRVTDGEQVLVTLQQ